MKKIRVKYIFFFLIFCVLFIVLSLVSFSPFMVSNGTLLTKKEVANFDYSYTLGDANNFGFERKNIYLFDFRIHENPPVIKEESNDNSLLIKSDFKKIYPGVWCSQNNQELIVRVFAYERGTKRYYFLYKSL